MNRRTLLGCGVLLFALFNTSAVNSLPCLLTLDPWIYKLNLLEKSLQDK